MVKYSVLTYNLNNYEIFREISPEVYNPDVEYVYITDDKSITSSTWTIKYIEKPDDYASYFDFIYKLRYTPFEYVSNDIVLIIDGSVELNTDLSPIIQFFAENNYDYAIMPHQDANTVLQEYLRWTQINSYNIAYVEKALKFLDEQNYDVFRYKGLYLATVQIQKKSSFTSQLNALVYNFCKMIGDIEPKSNLGIERVDQIILSFVLNKWFSDKKVLALDSDMLNYRELIWHHHNTGQIRLCHRTIQAYLFNEPCVLYSLYGNTEENDT